MSKLTLTNKRYINKHYTNMTVASIAKELKKPIALVTNYIKIELGAEPLPDPTNMSATQEISEEVNLRNKPIWISLQDQYTIKELSIFEEKYHSYMKQFQYDVQPTEEQQIFHMIGLEIEIDRNKAARKRNLDLKELRLKKIATLERTATEEDSHTDDIRRLNDDVSALESATYNGMRELKDLLDRHNDLATQLKGTRDQRLNEATSNKVSWVDIIKRLNSPEAREFEAKRIAALNQAVEKERERLTSYHTFADGKVDQPILNVEGAKNG